MSKFLYFLVCPEAYPNVLGCCWGTPISDKPFWMSCALTTGMQTGKKGQNRTIMVNRIFPTGLPSEGHKKSLPCHQGKVGTRTEGGRNGARDEGSFAANMPGLSWVGESHPQKIFDSLQWALKMNRFNTKQNEWVSIVATTFNIYQFFSLPMIIYGLPFYHPVSTINLR